MMDCTALMFLFGLSRDKDRRLAHFDIFIIIFIIIVKINCWLIVWRGGFGLLFFFFFFFFLCRKRSV